MQERQYVLKPSGFIFHKYKRLVLFVSAEQWIFKGDFNEEKVAIEKHNTFYLGLFLNCHLCKVFLNEPEPFPAPALPSSTFVSELFAPFCEDSEYYVTNLFNKK